MHLILLKFSDNKARAGDFMDGHKAWIERGFADGVFLMSGSLQSGGGAVLAHGFNTDEIEARVNDDPFVAENVVRAEIHAVAPSRADPRLDFLIGGASA